MPSEWAEQSSIQLTWPHAGTDWRKYLNDIYKVYISMADVITHHEQLLIVSPEPDIVRKQLESTLTDCQMSKVVFHQCPTNDTWARDHGFITLTGSGMPQLLDFHFNGWGNKFPAELDDAINKSLYLHGVIKGDYVDMNDFILEGGSIESDGKGTVFTTSQCLLAPHRNTNMTRSEIETRLKESLNAERIIWINHGHLEGDDTDGHIDTLVRTAPNDTLLYVGCEDKTDNHYTDLKLMENELKQLRTSDGRPYRLLKLPMPSPIYDKNDRLPATYANFVIINGAIIYPTYGQPDKDNEAARVIGKAFPNRELIGINSCAVIRQHGSLHCCTMQLYCSIS